MGCASSTPAADGAAAAAPATVNKGVPAENEALLTAAQSGDVEAARAALERGAITECLAAYGGFTPLLKAADGAAFQSKVNSLGGDYYGALQAYTDVATLLLEKGANKDAKNDDGNTALHLAARNGYDGIVKVLLEKGANKDAKNNGERTPLHYAAMDNKMEVVKLLLEKGANKDAKDDDGRTPLDIAGNEARAVLQ